MNGEDVTGLTSRQVRDKGVAYIPSDRLRRGMVASLSLSRNSVLGMHHHAQFNKRGTLLEDTIQEYAESIIAQHDTGRLHPSTYGLIIRWESAEDGGRP